MLGVDEELDLLEFEEELKQKVVEIPSPKNCDLPDDCMVVDFDEKNFKIYLECYPEMESQVRDLLAIKGIKSESEYYQFHDPCREMKWRAKRQDLKEWMCYK